MSQNEPAPGRPASPQTPRLFQQKSLLKDLKLIFPTSEIVELIPSESGKTMLCHKKGCGAQSHFYTPVRGVPTPGCLNCMLRKPSASRINIGQMMVRRGLVTAEQVNHILARQMQTAKRERARRFAELSVEMQLVSPLAAMNCLAEIYYFQVLDLSQRQTDDLSSIKYIPAAICHQYKTICTGKKNQLFEVAFADPFDEEAILAVARCFERPVVTISPYLAVREEIDRILEGHKEKSVELLSGSNVFPSDALMIDSLSEDEDIIEIDEREEDLSAMAVVSDDLIRKEYKSLLKEAINRRASDIHIEPVNSQVYAYRFRIDGVLQPARPVLKDYGLGVIQVIKFEANLDTGDRPDKVYEGSYSISSRKKQYRIRVEYLPTFISGKCRPKINLRILDPDTTAKSLDDLGFDSNTRLLLMRVTKQPNGIALFAGPTGMGKSTTLAALAREKADPNRNGGEDLMIYSLEDPIEYGIKGVNQIQVETRKAFKGVRDYATILRAIQRSDPNVVLVGEIRDRSTAGSCYRLAIAGNLVFGTIHASDSPGVITRLRNFKVEQFLIGDYTRIILSQRLVRRLCNACKTEIILPHDTIRAAGFYYPHEVDVRVWMPNPSGCERCMKGYLGRAVIAEPLIISPKIKDLIVRGKNENQIRMTAIWEGMQTLRQSGFDLVQKSITSIAEVQRVTGDFADPAVEAMRRKEKKDRASRRKEDVYAELEQGG